MLGLYVHTPFCKQKCPYCNFYSAPGTQEQVEQYFDALNRHITQWGKQNKLAVDSIYFGGGTPGLYPQHIAHTLKHIKTQFVLSDTCEISIEANPGCINLQGLRLLFEAGVNRISFGVQSANEAQLKALGRIHTVKDAQNSIELAKAAGFVNISVDFMLGTPGQDLSCVAHMEQFLRQSDVTHVSAYMLKVEPDTPFGKLGDHLALPDEDTVANLYVATVQMLKDLGYDQYEISNFAKPNFACRHNLKYWDLDPYLGIGPGAHSLYLNKRFYYPSDTFEFLQSDQSAVIFDGQPDMDEYVMLKLRQCAGLDANGVQNLPQGLQSRAAQLQKYGLCTVDHGVIALTTQGFLLSNQVIGKLLYG